MKNHQSWRRRSMLQWAPWRSLSRAGARGSATQRASSPWAKLSMRTGRCSQYSLPISAQTSVAAATPSSISGGVPALITSISLPLRPSRSSPSSRASASLRGGAADRVHCYTGAGRAGATELPPELQIIAPTAPPARVTPSSWCFRISTGLAHELLTLTQKYNVSWDVSLIDYTHRTPNDLCVRGVRAQLPQPPRARRPSRLC